ncbi:MAG: sulfotransferase [Nitrospirae bacterium]|nr:sulfotransferase [Nitrospirota bacterium]
MSLKPGVKTTFVIGLPRSGTTLLAYMLAGGGGVLSLSEPFLSLSARRHRLLNWLYFPEILKCRINPPMDCNEEDFLHYLKGFSNKLGLSSLVIKETYRLAPYLENRALMNYIATCGDPVAAIMRHPYDTASSTLLWARHQLRGVPGIVNRIVVPRFPEFSDDRQVVEWFARNWVSFADWCKRTQPFIIKYEDLVRNPGPALEMLCERCAIPFTPKMLDNNSPRFFSGMSGDPGGMNKHRKKLNVRPVGRSDDLKPEFLDIIKKTCGEAAEEMGYTL